MIVLLTGNNSKQLEKVYDEFINSRLMSRLDIYTNQELNSSMNKIAIATEDEIKELLSKNNKKVFSIYSLGKKTKIKEAKILDCKDTIDGFFEICKTILEDNFNIVHGKWNELND